MWAYIKRAINSNLSVPLSDTIGNNSDTASLIGSLHAKLHALTPSIPVVDNLNQTSATINAYYTVANYTGIGYAKKVYVRRDVVSGTPPSHSFSVKITLDGVVSILPAYFLNLQPDFHIPTPNTPVKLVHEYDISAYFGTSYKVEVSVDANVDFHALVEYNKLI